MKKITNFGLCIAFLIVFSNWAAASKPHVSISANPGSTICEGTLVTFIANVTNATSATYSWHRYRNNKWIILVNNGNYYHRTSNILNGDIFRCDVVARHNGHSYDIHSSISLTVNQLPVVAAITGSNSVYIGSTTTLTDATSGGTWSSSVPSVATVDANGVVTGVGTGTTNITYQLSNTHGCTTSSSYTIASTQVPPSITSISSLELCTGNNVLTVNGSNFLNINSISIRINNSTCTYSNFTSNTNTIQVNGVSVPTPSIPTSYPITVTVTTPGGSSTISGNIIIQPSLTPSISIHSNLTGPLCSGTQVNFWVSGTNEGQTPVYQWYVNGVPAGTGLNFSITPTNTIEVYCTLTTTSPCLCTITTTSTPMTIAVIPIPHISDVSSNYHKQGFSSNTATFTINGTGLDGAYHVELVNPDHNVNHVYYPSITSVSSTQVIATISIPPGATYPIMVDGEYTLNLYFPDTYCHGEATYYPIDIFGGTP